MVTAYRHPTVVDDEVAAAVPTRLDYHARVLLARRGRDPGACGGLDGSDGRGGERGVCRATRPTADRVGAAAASGGAFPAPGGAVWSAPASAARAAAAGRRGGGGAGRGGGLGGRRLWLCALAVLPDRLGRPPRPAQAAIPGQADGGAGGRFRRPRRAPPAGRRGPVRHHPG